MAAPLAKVPGNVIAAALTGAWRQSPPPLELSAADLEQATPLLCATGAGALVWRRVRETPLQTLPAANNLRQVYRLQTLAAARGERDIQNIFQMLQSSGIEALLLKGWAAARLYPEKGMRPWSDIDLYVRPRDYAKATTLVGSCPALSYAVDWYHVELAGLDEGGVEGLYARSRCVRVGGIDVSVPGEADHLRLLCLHWLRHHAWRPLWLCDIAAALECRRADFDWDVCLRGNARQAEWIICALALARQLLGAAIDDAPTAVSGRRAPRWLARAVLKQWQLPSKQHRPDNLPMLTLLRRRAGLLTALRARWPNPLEATYDGRGPFTRLPRLPFQLGFYLTRAISFQARLPGLLRDES